MKVWKIIEEAVKAALEELGRIHGVDLSNQVPVVEIPKFENQGDFATPVALSLARHLRRPPIQIAEELKSLLSLPQGLFDNVEVARPGYINFFVSFDAYFNNLEAVLKDVKGFMRSDVGGGRRVLLEFVSANPTGPLHVGHARGAIYGDALARVMRTAGYAVDTEYYVNDRGNQISMLGLSVYARGRELLGLKADFPENGYKGTYIRDLAKVLLKELGEEVFKRDYEALGPSDATPIARGAMLRLLEEIKADLSRLGITFDSFFHERSLYEPHNKVQEAIDFLSANGLIYKDETGALLFKATDFGDTQDRVVVRSNGQPTYFASDIAYHADKLSRGYDTLINIWGADHHGYIPRMKGAISALGHDPEILEVLLVQMVSLVKGGQPVTMGKRSGDYYTLADLVEEVGSDAVRFIFLTRKPDAHMDFDVDLARSASMENPVYYVQYGHARLRSILSKAGLDTNSLEFMSELGMELKYPEEQSIVKRIVLFPYTIEQAAVTRQVHLLSFSLIDLVKQFHSYYTKYKGTDKVLAEDPRVRQARLIMSGALAEVLKEGLELLGVSAPQRMSRDEG